MARGTTTDYLKTPRRLLELVLGAIVVAYFTLISGIIIFYMVPKLNEVSDRLAYIEGQFKNFNERIERLETKLGTFEIQLSWGVWRRPFQTALITATTDQALKVHWLGADGKLSTFHPRVSADSGKTLRTQLSKVVGKLQEQQKTRAWSFKTIERSLLSIAADLVDKQTVAPSYVDKEASYIFYKDVPDYYALMKSLQIEFDVTTHSIRKFHSWEELVTELDRDEALFKP